MEDISEADKCLFNAQSVKFTVLLVILAGLRLLKFKLTGSFGYDSFENLCKACIQDFFC